MKITRTQLRKLVRESANYGMIYYKRAKSIHPNLKVVWPPEDRFREGLRDNSILTPREIPHNAVVLHDWTMGVGYPAIISKLGIFQLDEDSYFNMDPRDYGVTHIAVGIRELRKIAAILVNHHPDAGIDSANQNFPGVGTMAGLPDFGNLDLQDVLMNDKGARASIKNAGYDIGPTGELFRLLGNKSGAVNEAKWNREKRRYELEDWDLRRAAEYEVDLADRGISHVIYPEEAIQIGYNDYNFEKINFPYAFRSGHQGETEAWKWDPDQNDWNLVQD